MDNPETMETEGTLGEDKLNKGKAQYVLDTTIRKQKENT